MNILLIPYHRDFLESVCAWRNDPVSLKYNPVQDLSLKALHKMYAASHSDLSDFNNAKLFFWFIECDKKLVGNIVMRNINRLMLTAEIGYNIAPESRGRGYATEAVRLVAQKAFTESPLRKLIAYVHEDNIASRKVLEKVGYKAEGLLREHYLIKGAPVNEIFHGILRREVIL